MAMTRQKIFKLLEKCWDNLYEQHDLEAEWYGGNIPDHIWLCDVPSAKKSIKLTLDIDTKIIKVEEREIIHFDREPWKSKYGEWEHVNDYPN